MERYKIDPVQARTYVINNRHNHATALYYLILQRDKSKQQISSSDTKIPSQKEIK